MNYFAIGLLAVLIYVLGYGLVDRICHAIEHCATAKAISKMNAQGLQIRPDDMEKFIKEQTDDGK